MLCLRPSRWEGAGQVKEQVGGDWLRAWAQPVTYLGIAMLAIIGAGLAHLLAQDRERGDRDARREAENLVRVFEQSIARAFRSADTSLRQLRRAYQSDPQNTNLLVWVSSPELRNELAFQISVTDKRGVIVASSFGPGAVGIDLSHQPHFQVHVDSPEDRLFISEPRTLRTSGRKSVILTRRLQKPDGAFDGVISAMIDIAELEKFYRTIDLGADGFVSLIGVDGVIRAAGANGQSRWDLIGGRFPNAGVLTAAMQSDHGVYWTEAGLRSAEVEDVKRLIAYRKVEGFPLIAVVGMAESQIYEQARANERIYVAVAILLACGVLIAVGSGFLRERKLAATSASLARSKLWLETALENMTHGLCMFDSEQRLVVCNGRYAEMYGLTPDQVQPGTFLEDILRARVAAGFCTENADDYIATRLAEAVSWDVGEIVNELRNGRVYAITRRSMPDGGSVAIHQDITLQRRAEERIRHLALHDGLTDLANRVRFQEEIDAALAKLKDGGERFNVLVLDLDHFKDINDTLGHAAGDALIRQVAARLTASLGQRDLVARIGGDEFAILQPVHEDQAGLATVLADRIMQELGKPFNLDGHLAIVQTSIGIVLAPGDGDDGQQLLKNADLALYRAKAEGRNTYRFFDAHLADEARARYELEVDFREAVERGEFELHYQPLVDMDSRSICGAEALVRWRHPQRGLIRPDVFIPLAESTGLIVRLGEWVLNRACADAAQWPAHARVAVNLSPVQFRKGDIVAAVASALAASGLAADRLELEITESVLLHKDESNLHKLHRLKSLGASIALDDFGTGYSSLSYLQMFPFDKIKIDKSFISGMADRADCAAIVIAVAGLARMLDVTTTAEGVETLAQIALLQAAGCRQAQGYLFGRPVPVSQLRFGGVTAALGLQQAVA
jgi:diguanylate cyclase (GGDEF)-like protein